MRTAEVIKHFGSQKAAAAALTKAGYRLSQPSVSLWGEYPPDMRQLQIERITRNKLKAEPGCKSRLLGLPETKRATAKAD